MSRYLSPTYIKEVSLGSPTYFFACKMHLTFLLRFFSKTFQKNNTRERASKRWEMKTIFNNCLSDCRFVAAAVGKERWLLLAVGMAKSTALQWESKKNIRRVWNKGKSLSLLLLRKKRSKSFPKLSCLAFFLLCVWKYEIFFLSILNLHQQWTQEK